MAQQAHDLAKQYGINQSTLKHIQQKAENNIAMDTPTAEKQAVYNAYQNYYKSEVTKKAKEGTSLERPNEWKNSLYSQASQNINSNDRAYFSNENIMGRAESQSDSFMGKQDQLLRQNSAAQYASAEAQYAKIKEQQISDLKAELDQAVADGKMSVQEAETAYAKQGEAIQAQNYLDSEYSKAQAQGRGIQNSQQFLGMEQTRQANTTSLLNSNMTDRDNKIFQINTRLQQVTANVNRGISSANTNYQLNVTGAQADIDAQMYQNQFDLRNREYDRIQNLQSQLDLQGLGQRHTQDNMKLDQQFNKENMSIQQGYTQQNMATQQSYTQQNMATEQAYALQQMSQQQKYQLEQMAKQYGYDINKMSVQQKYQLAQMAQSYGYDMSLQGSQQAFQAGQASLDRQQQVSMQNLQHQNQLQYDNQSYQNQLNREYNAYNVSSSKEYKLRTAQEKAGVSAAQTQSMLNLLTETQIIGLSSRMESLPTLSTKPKQSEINAYNKQVNNINDYIKQIAPDAYSTFKIPTYSGGSSTTTNNKTSQYQSYQNSVWSGGK